MNKVANGLWREAVSVINSETFVTKSQPRVMFYVKRSSCHQEIYNTKLRDFNQNKNRS